MARIPSLVWAVPMTLAALVLAKGVLERRWSPPPPANRVAPALVERLEPPGRLHAPAHARPVSAAPPTGALDVQPASTDGTLPLTAPAVVETRIQIRDVPPAPPRPQQPAPILYPIVETSELPQMAEEFPGIAAAPQRLPSESKPRSAHGTTFTRAASSPLGEPALAAVRQQVGAMNQKAVNLAKRGALYSARAELLEALRLIAQSHDAQSGTTHKSSALAAAITALDESDDFTPPGSRGAAVAVADIIRPHQTPVLKRIDATRLSPLTCSQHYYAYAQQQLGEATGGQPIAANTLSLLGMVHGHLAGQSAGGKSSHTARAIVFHQATLALQPAHYRSANELGVLWARCGELPAARQMLVASLQSHPTPSAWHNLAAVHDRLGEKELAQLARKEATLLSPKGQTEAGQPSVEWVDAATFAAKSPADGSEAPGKSVQVSTASHASAPNQAVRR
jgi:tetratricopeptide (TPR) repeat protein